MQLIIDLIQYTVPVMLVLAGFNNFLNALQEYLHNKKY